MGYHSDKDEDYTAFKIYRYTEYQDSPSIIDFKTGLNISLEKGPVTYDRKGSPIEVKYYYQEEEILKRTWNFTYFNVESLMSELQISQAQAEAMADDLVWHRECTFHWQLEDNTYSPNTKVISRNFVPFVNGMPDLASYYASRISERQTGRKIIMNQLQVEVVGFLIASGDTVEQARLKGVDLLQDYKTAFDNYIDVADEDIYSYLMIDVSHSMLNEATSIGGVDIRQYIINRLKQLEDLSTPL